MHIQTSNKQLHIQSIYKKKLFSPNDDFYYHYKYPNFVQKLKEKDLIGLQCSPKYELNYTDIYREKVLDYKNYKPKNLKDPQLLEFLKKENTRIQKSWKMATYSANTVMADAGTEKPISEITKCTTERGQIIIEYDVFNGGGGGNNTAYFGYLQDDLSLKPIISIVNDGVEYFSCIQPLALTTDNKLFYECGGGYGSSIYSINLNTGEKQLKYKCNQDPGIFHTPLQDNIWTCLLYGE